jgi:hypothetical protein
LANNGEGGLDDDGLIIAQLTVVAHVFIDDYGFGQVPPFSHTSKSGRAATVIPRECILGVIW